MQTVGIETLLLDECIKHIHIKYRKINCIKAILLFIFCLIQTFEFKLYIYKFFFSKKEVFFLSFDGRSVLTVLFLFIPAGESSL